MHAVRWAFRDAEQESPRRLQRAGLDAGPACRPFSASSLRCSSPTRPCAPRPRRARSSPPCQQRLWGRGISRGRPDRPRPRERSRCPAPSRDARRAALSSRVRRPPGSRPRRRAGLRLYDRRLRDPSSYARAERRRRVAQSTRRRLRDRGRSGRSDGGSSPRGVRARRARYARRLARRAPRTRVESPPTLPRFEPTLADEPAERRRPRPRLLFDNGIGGFTEDGREYVLEVTPGAPTPAPWCNVLANPEFRLPRRASRRSGPPGRSTAERTASRPGETIRSSIPPPRRCTCATKRPRRSGRRRRCLRDGGQTLVRHGAGYTTYERESHGLVQELTVFVPADAALKVVRLRLKNTLASSPAADRDVLRRVGSRQSARGTATVHRVRVRPRARVPPRTMRLECGVRRARRVPGLEVERAWCSRPIARNFWAVAATTRAPRRSNAGACPAASTSAPTRAPPCRSTSSWRPVK